MRSSGTLADGSSGGSRRGSRELAQDAPKLIRPVLHCSDVRQSHSESHDAAFFLGRSISEPSTRMRSGLQPLAGKWS